MIDTHCHLDVADFGADRPEVLARARAAGITTMVCIGSGRDLGAAREAVRLAGVEPDVYAAVGVHPHDVAGMTEADWDELARLARAPRVVGIGETGLDYYYDHSPREAQRAAYRRFIALAREVGRPVISHIRDAHDDAAEILGETGAAALGGVIHCFSGGVDDARRYLEPRPVPVVLGDPHVQDRGADPRGGGVRARRSHPGRDRRALPGADPPSRQAQRARVRGQDAGDAGRRARA